MADYTFYVAALRFVAGRTENVDARVTEMMQILSDAATAIETKGAYTVAADKLETTARAFAGVAGFLHKQILPEALAEGNTAGATQIRWAIDAAMEAVNLLLARHAVPDGKAVELPLGEPPIDGAA